VAAELEVDIIAVSSLWRGHEDVLSRALAAAAAEEGAEGSVSLLLGDDASVAALNAQFRGKNGPTNVLSFPPPLAGPGTIVEEANFQGKRFEHHAAHLAVHGFLHLLGYDHTEPGEAERMEARERAILAILGIEDPYA
jgi:probable rRNA maturation factor